MIPVLILTAIDVVLAACVYAQRVHLIATSRRLEKCNHDRKYWMRRCDDLLIRERRAAVERSARARHARQCQIEQDRARKAEEAAR